MLQAVSEIVQVLDPKPHAAIQSAGDQRLSVGAGYCCRDESAYRGANSFPEEFWISAACLACEGGCAPWHADKEKAALAFRREAFGFAK
jgi:hypothetical protein